MEIGGYVMSMISYIPLRMNQYGAVQEPTHGCRDAATGIVAIL